MKVLTWDEDWDEGDTVVEYDSIKKLVKEIKKYPNEYARTKIIIVEEVLNSLQFLEKYEE